jgi:GrpB-like predicted nucleotidyltransferase (UPF0157 family)
MAHTPVMLSPYDPRWATSFTEQRARLATLLAPWLAGPLEHIGSTAVPGLPAEPVVDILAQVASLDGRAGITEALTAEGWWPWPGDPHAAVRLRFLLPGPRDRTHHLHVRAAGDPEATALVRFRDALRADPARAVAYALLKSRLAAAHPHDAEAYAAGKSAFVAETLAAGPR